MEDKLYITQEIYNMIAGRKKLDQQIADAERDAERLEFLENDIEKNNMHEKHKEYFKDKEYKDLDWNEIHLLADVQKEEAEMQEREKNLSMSDIYQRLKKLRKDENLSSGFDDNSITNFPSTLDGLTDIINRTIDVIEEMLSNPQCQHKEKLMKIEQILYQMREKWIRENPNEKPSEQSGTMPQSSHSPVRTEIENQAPVSVSKWDKETKQEFLQRISGLEGVIVEKLTTEHLEKYKDDFGYQKHFSVPIKKSGDIVEGFASVEIVDNQSDLLPLSVLEKALPQYLQHGTIMLSHSNRPVGRIIAHETRKTWDGHPGLYIKAKLFPGCKDVIKMIDDGELRGFSIAGLATLKNSCKKATCWRNIEKLRLDEISIVRNPANKEAVLT